MRVERNENGFGIVCLSAVCERDGLVPVVVRVAVVVLGSGSSTCTKQLFQGARLPFCLFVTSFERHVMLVRQTSSRYTHNTHLGLHTPADTGK